MAWQVILLTYLVQLPSYLIVRCAARVFWAQEEKREQPRSFWRAAEEHSGYSLVEWTMPEHPLDWFLPVNQWGTLGWDWGWDLCLGLRFLPRERHTRQNSLSLLPQALVHWQQLLTDRASFLIKEKNLLDLFLNWIDTHCKWAKKHIKWQDLYKDLMVLWRHEAYKR